MHKCGLQIYKKRIILWYVFLAQISVVKSWKYFVNVSACHWFLLISLQTSSSMSKAVGMFMLLLTSMWKLSVLRVTTNTMLKNMVCRLITELLLATLHLHCKFWSEAVSIYHLPKLVSLDLFTLSVRFWICGSQGICAWLWACYAVYFLWILSLVFILPLNHLLKPVFLRIFLWLWNFLNNFLNAFLELMFIPGC